MGIPLERLRVPHIDTELSRLRAELLAIEGLISKLLDGQAKLHSGLVGLYPPGLDNNQPVDD